MFFNVKHIYIFSRKYSVQGSKYRRSYKYTLNHDTEIYNFIGIDACMNPGPKRPFNFLGVLQKVNMIFILYICIYMHLSCTSFPITSFNFLVIFTCVCVIIPPLKLW